MSFKNFIFISCLVFLTVSCTKTKSGNPILSGVELEEVSGETEAELVACNIFLDVILPLSYPYGAHIGGPEDILKSSSPIDFSKGGNTPEDFDISFLEDGTYSGASILNVATLVHEDEDYYYSASVKQHPKINDDYTVQYENGEMVVEDLLTMVLVDKKTGATAIAFKKKILGYGSKPVPRIFSFDHFSQPVFC